MALQIAYTRHAPDRMIEQAIHEKDVEKVLRNADSIVPARMGRLNAFKQIEGWLVRVIFLLESGTMTDPLPSNHHHRLRRATSMKHPIEITSEGAAGPAYVRYTRERQALTHATPMNPDVVVDYDVQGGIIGVELACLEDEDFRVFQALAFVHNLKMPSAETLRTAARIEAVTA